MAVRRNDYNTGTGSVTASNSANNGDAFTAVEATQSYDSGSAFAGAQGCISTSAAVSAYARCAISSSVARAMIHFKINTVPTADCHLIQVHTTGLVRRASLHINAAGKLRLSDATGTTGVWTATDAISADTWYRIELVAESNTTTTGVLKAAYYSAAGSLIEDYSSTTANVGDGLTFSDITLGKRSSVTYVVSMDEVGWDDAAGGYEFIGFGATQETTAALTVTPAAAAEGLGCVVTVNDGSGATDVSGTWASEGNAWDDVSTTYATTDGSVTTHVIDISGYDFGSVVGADDTLASVSVNVAQFVNDAARFNAPTVQAYDDTTPIGSPVALAERTGAGSEDVVLPGITLAQIRSATFKIRFSVEQTS